MVTRTKITREQMQSWLDNLHSIKDEIGSFAMFGEVEPIDEAYRSIVDAIEHLREVRVARK